MPNKLHEHSLSCRNGQDAIQLFFPLMFMFRDKLSQIPPVPKDYNVTSPPPRNASPTRVATIYNKLTGGGGGWCVSIQAPSLPGPSFMHVWSSVCCLFLHLPSLLVRFIGQACVGCETIHKSHHHINRCRKSLWKNSTSFNNKKL
jgi:hypothetical protein